MVAKAKSEQLQIRVSPAEKARIQRAAARAGLDMSQFVLARALDGAVARLTDALTAVGSGDSRFALAELNSLLADMTAGELTDAVTGVLPNGLPANYSQQDANYVAAMIETACAQHGVPVPRWALEVPPLVEPWFGSSLQSLRLYLLTNAPAAFRRRNIFIDASIGARV